MSQLLLTSIVVQADQYFQSGKKMLLQEFLVNHPFSLHTTSTKTYTVTCSKYEINQTSLATCCLFRHSRSHMCSVISNHAFVYISTCISFHTVMNGRDAINLAVNTVINFILSLIYGFSHVLQQ